MNPGTQQSQRFPAALRPGYVLPDELSFAERLSATLAFASWIPFHDDQGIPKGYWSEALDRDDAFLLGEIAAFPIERIQNRFLEALPSAPLYRSVQDLWDFAVYLDRWLNLLQHHHFDGVRSIAALLQVEIENRLSEPFRDCIQRYGHALVFTPVETALKSLHPSWRMEDASLDILLNDPQPDPRMGDGRMDPDGIRNLFLNFIDVVQRLKPLAIKELTLSLNAQRHDPAIGLLLTFMRLYERAQAPLNRFADRLADFYHRDILRMKPRSAARDQVHLVCTPAPGFKGSLLIRPGERFVGGKNAAGAAYEFAVDQPLVVSDARVVELCTLCLERDPLISPERELGFATRVKSQQIQVQPPEQADVPHPNWWLLFGGQTKASNVQDARLGFAVSSPILELQEGDREIRLRILLRHPTDENAALQQELKRELRGRDQVWMAGIFERYLALEESGSVHASAQAMARKAMARRAELKPMALRQAMEGTQYLAYWAARCLEAVDAKSLSTCLGRLMTAWMISPGEMLVEADRCVLRQHVQKTLGEEGASLHADDPLSLFLSEKSPEPMLVFDRLFRGLLKARFSAPTGWVDISDISIRRVEEASRVWQGGTLELRMRLRAEHPAVVACQALIHGSQWPAQAMFQFEMQTQTRVFGYSLLQQIEWRDLEIEVSVQGLRNLVLNNQMGRLDPSKPFHPFGPLPECGHYLVMGSPELATKPLRMLCLNVEWGGLPRGLGGFAEHYQDYPGSWRNDGFQVQPGFLRDGRWETGLGASIPLFESLEGSGLPKTAALSADPIDIRRFFRVSAPLPSGATFQFDLNRRNGFFRFVLAGPENAFGHSIFARLLTETLSRNARKKTPDPLPREPYTPIIERLTVDYRAGQSLQLGLQAGKASADDPTCERLHRLFHLHPFGEEELLPGSRTPLVPRMEHDGNLYIGLEADRLQGPLNVFFHLRREAAAECWVQHRPPTHWAVWTGRGWRDLLAEQILSDSTQGFLCSGIVRLDLPEDMSLGCPRLPGSLYWLRLSADWGFDLFAGLYGVHVHALCATRVDPPMEGDLALPPGTIQAPLRSLAGLQRVQQVGSSFGLRKADTREWTRVRCGERLRHKGRASGAWDYERLLLDAFPEVFKVKCFSHHRNTQGADRVQEGVQPGQVLLVVVPAPREGELFESTEAPRLDPAALEQMTEYLRGKASPGVQLCVRNVGYERIQVRCAVKLQVGSHAGTSLRVLNEALIRYLSPWHAEGYDARFDWEVRAEELEAHLRAQECVESVSQLSMLHVVQKGGDRYLLMDSARNHAKDPESHCWSTQPVRPAVAGSLALPMPNHLIELVDHSGAAAPRTTGISRVEIGNTFIIQ